MWTEKFKRVEKIIQTFWWLIDKNPAMCWKCDISEWLESWHPSPHTHVISADTSDHIWCKFQEYEERVHSRCVCTFYCNSHQKFLSQYFVQIPQLSVRVILHDVLIVSHLFLMDRLPRCLTLYSFSWWKYYKSYLFGNMLHLFFNILCHLFSYLNISEKFEASKQLCLVLVMSDTKHR